MVAFIYLAEITHGSPSHHNGIHAYVLKMSHVKVERQRNNNDEKKE
jgi:hypothetical protein